MDRNSRSTREVVESHLEHRRRGDLEGDLRQNYATDVVVLSAEGIHRGHDALRLTASVLKSYLEHSDFDYDQVLVTDEYGLLNWSAQDGGTEIHDGADSYVVRDGLIVMQSIHYSVDRSSGDRSAPDA
jgi:hypothetical protein